MMRGFALVSSLLGLLIVGMAVSAQETLDLRALGLEATPRETSTGLPTDSRSPASRQTPPATRAIEGPDLDTAAEKIIYQDTPISLSIPVGQWKVLTLPADTLKVGKIALLAGTLEVKSVGAEVHLLAHKPFDAVPLPISELTPTGEPGRTFVFYVTATPEASGARVEILTPQTSTIDGDTAPTQGYDKITLARFVLQQLYAEPRLIQPLAGVNPVAVENTPVALVRATVAGGAVRAVPLQTWADGWQYATAVLLENQSSRTVTLDPRTSLRGDFLAATAWQSVLGPRGSGQHLTTVVLISSRPFHEALGAFGDIP